MFKFKSAEHLTHLQENATNCIIAEHLMMETLLEGIIQISQKE